MKLRRIFALAGSSLSAIAGFGLLLAAFSVPESDRALELSGYDHLYQGEPFTGIVYRLYRHRLPQHVALIWQGRKIGTEFLWYDDGTLMAEQPHRDGRPHGEWRQWFRGGRVKSLRTYVDGVIHGESWAWHPNGQVASYISYENGQEVAYKSWIADGTPFYNYVYQDGHKVGIGGGEYCKRLSKIRR